jgi:hypothetical protein
MGGFLAICMFGLYFYSGEKVMLMVALIVAVITAGVATIERMIVTDKEKAYALLYDAARAGTRNDDAYLISLIKSDKAEIIGKAKRLLDDVTFENVRVVGVKTFEAAEGDIPKTATINFVTFGSGRYRNNAGPFQREVKLDLQMVNEQWKVIGFSHANPRGGVSL